MKTMENKTTNRARKIMKKAKIESTPEAWENGHLGRSAANAKRAPAELEQQIEEAMGMQMISIRLQKELIDDFKKIADFHGVGYQPLMRDALKRFAEGEFKKIAIEYANMKAATVKEKAGGEKAEAAHQKIAA
jgi:uncharacterized protein (DUF4415 family)